MSWTRRPQRSAAPPPGPDQDYTAQPFGNQQTMYQNYTSDAPNTQQQQFWPQQQPQYNQQYGQVYQQQEYGNNANQLYQQPHYNQGYNNQTYNNTQPGYQQQTYYQNQGQPQTYPSKQGHDGWEDNWDWGWDESSKQAQQAQGVANLPTTQPQQQAFNNPNANVIEESFASNDTWNWSTEDKTEKQHLMLVPSKESIQPAALPLENPTIESKISEQSRDGISSSGPQPSDEIKLSDRETVKEHLPNLALGKRFHLDNLTPQWSIESQMSQESSDGPHTHSESTYRSENQSRNSSKSSPVPNTDNSNFNYSQSELDETCQHNNEWSRRSIDESTLIDNVQSDKSKHESHEGLVNSLDQMTIVNRENPTPDTLQAHNGDEGRNVQQNISAQVQPPVPSLSPASFPPSSSLNLPPSSSTTAIPPPPPTSLTTVPHPPISAALPPTMTFPPSSSASAQNPFKHSGPFSHKTTVKVPLNTTNQSFAHSTANTGLSSPTVVNKISQHNRASVGFGANLETTPDNSERPDHPQVSTYRSVPVAQQVPDNLEVAPKNDRNEYLQTAHLSTGDYGENTDFSRNVPPPGLRRMGVGQHESEYNQNLNITHDEPPPGLARMVPGQHTEGENNYNQTSDNYMERLIDGQPTDGSGRPYRQADGQQTPDNYTQPPTNRGTERRPIGLDRMVPGEPSNNVYPQFAGSAYAGANEQRVVTGVDHDYPVDVGVVDIREQNVDGSDYTEQASRNPSRNVIGAREASNDTTTDYNPSPEEHQREVIMEGENLQDLSGLQSSDITFSREQIVDGADLNAIDAGIDRKTDVSDSLENQASSSRIQSFSRMNSSGEESERDRAFKSSPRRDRDKHKSTRDRDREKDGRYRDDRKYDRESDRKLGRDERRSEKDRRDRDRDRRDRDESPDPRRHRRSTKSHRYETEDTDYYSDRERDRRRYREGSYTSSKPPRPDDRDRRYRDERDRNRRYNTIVRDRRYDERDDANRSRRSDRHDRYERRYRDIDPTRKHGNLRREREEEERRRVVTFSDDANINNNIKAGQHDTLSAGSRPESREAPPTDEDAPEPRRRSERPRARASRHRADLYYDGYGAGAGAGGGAGADPFALQRQQYQYYEQLRITDPAAYMVLYKQLMAAAGRAPAPPDYLAGATPAKLYGEGYGSLGYEARGEERGSVHSGRSSANGLKGTDTDLNTDMSLNLHLEESTVRSERMTPFKFSTAHIKGSVSSRDVVVVRPSYPVDGAPATVHVVGLRAALAAAADPLLAELRACVGPLVRGVTHKKTVIEYCSSRIRNAEQEAGRDLIGWVLVWELLTLLLRQNGVVVGADLADLLAQNAARYPYRAPPDRKPRLWSRPNDDLRSDVVAPDQLSDDSAAAGSRRDSATRGDEPRTSTPDPVNNVVSDVMTRDDPISVRRTAVDEKAAVDILREHLTYGNRQEALEFAMEHGLWGHALHLSAYSDRRTRAAVASRFVTALPRADPLHTLYAALAAHTPPAVANAGDERWGDWRPHVAIILANESAQPDFDRQLLIQLGDGLAARGLAYSAQFCYVSAGAQLERHPLAPLTPPEPGVRAPPRLALLLADVRAPTLARFATPRAIFATEVYEYALSLGDASGGGGGGGGLDELQPYKWLTAVRLADCGAYERALAYLEQAARGLARARSPPAPALARRVVELAERLRPLEPALLHAPCASGAGAGAGGGPDPSGAADPPAPHWLDELHHTLAALQAGATPPQHTSPLHLHQGDYYAHSQYGWSVQQDTQQYQQPPSYADAVPSEETPDYAAQYYLQQQQQQEQAAEEPGHGSYGGEWPPQAPQPPPPHEDASHSYADPHWPDHYLAPEAEPAEPRPVITMPGARRAVDRDSAVGPARAGHDDGHEHHEENGADAAGAGPAGGGGERAQGRGGGGGAGAGRGGGGGWLGGILNKLSLRAPNQMILPDDKNPSIVWDAERKRWRNLDGDEDETGAAPPPPPPQLPLPPLPPLPSAALRSPNIPQPGSGSLGAPPSNIFKMQKGRNIKKSYVDVLNPGGGGGGGGGAGAASEALAPPPPEPYFVPAAPPAGYQSGLYDPTQFGEEYRSGI